MMLQMKRVDEKGGIMMCKLKLGRCIRKGILMWK